MRPSSDKRTYCRGPDGRFMSSGEGVSRQPRTRVYNGLSKSKPFRVDTVKSSTTEPLAGLADGKSVAITMGFNVSTGKRSVSPPRRDFLIVLTPGTSFGAKPGTLLVSVVGKGSAVVNPFLDRGVSSLVLAGIPSALARGLMAQCRRVMFRRTLCPQ